MSDVWKRNSKDKSSGPAEGPCSWTILNLHLLMGIILVGRKMKETNQNKTSSSRRPPILAELLNNSEQTARDSDKRKTQLLVVSLDATHRLRLGCAIHLALPVELMGVVTQNRDWHQIRIAS